MINNTSYSNLFESNIIYLDITENKDPKSHITCVALTLLKVKWNLEFWLTKFKWNIKPNVIIEVRLYLGVSR